MVQHFPPRRTRVVLRRPVSGVLGIAQETHGAFAGYKHTGISHAVDAGALGAGQHVGLAELAFVPAIGLKPVQAELGVRVEVVLSEEAVDELQRGAHAHRRAIGFEDSGVLREDGPARTNDGLRQVDRRYWGVDAAAGHLVESFRQSSVEFAEELAA